MYLIQLFLPLYSNTGRRFPKQKFIRVRDTLLARYQGVTVYARSAASGFWTPRPGETVVDEMLIFEVMAEQLSKTWWRDYRLRLEKSFAQENVLVRAQRVLIL